jgi:NAD(P)-dependent dehydrogenase (short-subunit alcohol dehydrogenase family)
MVITAEEQRTRRMTDLEGKVAIVTGAGDGIGRTEALTLARLGAAVVVNDVGRARAGALGGSADLVVAEILATGGAAVANRADVAEWKTGDDLLEQALGEFGRLDIVVSNAGVARRSFIVDVTENDFDLQVGVLFKGTFALVQHVAGYWKREFEAGERTPRAIVVTSSSAGVPGGVEESSVYGALKAALATFTLGAALEFRGFGVTINTILPHAASMMDSAFKGLAGPPSFAPEDMDPMNPQHVANVVAYLAQTRASWLSGQTLEITGTNVRRWVPWSAAGEVDSGVQWSAEHLDRALASTLYNTLPAGRVIPRT